MNEKTLPEDIVKSLSKRARIVVEHIIKYGSITTEDLETTYGYSHAPRAARDVREGGIPLETFFVLSSDERRIAAYKFGDLTKIQKDRLGGRTVFRKKFKDELYQISEGKCAICSGRFESRYLQIDHKVPYEVSGEISERKTEEYMLLCASCNRAKSWSCEHCPNWLADKSLAICSKCYWASPEGYMHIALKKIRRTDILWDESELQVYEKLSKAAQESNRPIPEYVKKIIKKCLG